MPLAAAWLQSCVAEKVHQVQVQPLTPSQCTGVDFLAAWLQQGGAAQPQGPMKALTGTRAKRQAPLRQMQCLPHPRITTPLLCT